MTETPEPGLKKRSIAIAGHRTSVALEEEFWHALESIADERRLTLAQLVGVIDEARARDHPGRALASACRVFALLNGRPNPSD
jgi:predicted DNA-binding ribbon-helix-helix protein